MMNAKPVSVIEREIRLAERANMTVERLIIEEEVENRHIKAEKAKLKKIAENSGIRAIERGEVDDG
ncbi:MAG: hypothetical protein FWH07_05315 [Oscillospiraceae bacterium]|nr:hypothetical protein [Oscillospiraceae bacterium]